MSDLFSRKFIYAILATALGFVLVLMNKVGSEAFLEFVKIVGATYVVSNVADKVVQK